MEERELRLVRLSGEWESAFREMHADIVAAGERRHDREADDFAGAIERLERAELGVVPDGLVPWTTYWLVDSDGNMLGGCRLRHRLSEALWQDGGHIGYDTRPSFRNRGLATHMLALALEKARNRGLTWVLLTVAPDNVASIRVIEKNGGQRIGVASESGNLQFRIDLA